MSGAAAAPTQSSPPSPRDYAVLIVGISVSLGLLVLVGYSLYLVQTNQSNQLGRIEGVGKGTGILGLVSLLVYLGAKVVAPEKKDGDKKPIRNTLVPVFSLLMTIVTGFVSARTASTVKQQMAKEKELNAEIAQLQASRGELLDFLHSVSRRENLRFVDQNVSDEDWRRAVSTIEKLPAGQRKKTVYGAILLAWQNISLSLKNAGGLVQGGVDSANFWKRVFANVGIDVAPRPSERVSDAMKRQFDEVTDPQPGDLLFYQGAEKNSVGNFVMMYLGPGKNGGHGICLGTYDIAKPVEVIDSYFFDLVKPPDKFLGYYRPKYGS